MEKYDNLTEDDLYLLLQAKTAALNALFSPTTHWLPMHSPHAVAKVSGLCAEIDALAKHSLRRHHEEERSRAKAALDARDKGAWVS